MNIDEIRDLCTDFVRELGEDPADPSLQPQLEKFVQDRAMMGTDPTETLGLLVYRFRDHFPHTQASSAADL